ncbi:unnamed protein product [Brassica rapa subsp. trilocularis]
MNGKELAKRGLFLSTRSLLKRLRSRILRPIETETSVEAPASCVVRSLIAIGRFRSIWRKDGPIRGRK